MWFLKILEGIRTPFLDAVMSAITQLGEENVLLVVALLIMWCVSKRAGYLLLVTSYASLLVNQFLKLALRVARPWVIDPEFTIVESARAQATGYSFPSGHTSNITAIGGCAAGICPKRWQKILCAAAIILVAFSRMYLGVHTPQDVLVSLIITLAIVFGIGRLFRIIDKKPAVMYSVIALIALTSAAFLVYTHFWRFPADIDAVNLADAQANSGKLLGAALGLALGFFIDHRYVKYEVKAVLWVQAVKFAVGLGLILALKTLLKAPFAALLGADVGDAFRYFILIVFATSIWPMAFKHLTKLSRNGGTK